MAATELHATASHTTERLDFANSALRSLSWDARSSVVVPASNSSESLSSGSLESLSTGDGGASLTCTAGRSVPTPAL